MKSLVLVSLLAVATGPWKQEAQPGPSSPSAEIVRIELRVGGAGHTSSHWRQISVDQQATIVSVERRGFVDERGTPVEPDAVEPGFSSPTRTQERFKTSTFEWKRLCRFIEETGLFAESGERALARGSHAGSARVAVTYADGSTATVTHGAFHSMSEPLMFWALVRVIDGGANHATRP